MTTEHPKFCPHCGAGVIGTMAFCTACGKSVLGQPAIAAPAKKGLPTPLIFLVVAGIVGALWFVSASLGTRGGAISSQPNAIGAWVDCKSFVTKSLKSPSTAVFPVSNEPGVSIHTLTNGHWVVVGYVDAQNSFGAPLRQTFGCELRYSGTNVTVEHLTIGEQVIQ